MKHIDMKTQDFLSKKLWGKNAALFETTIGNFSKITETAHQSTTKKGCLI